jgi:ribose 1,5-bisphosphokinase PhnN
VPERRRAPLRHLCQIDALDERGAFVMQWRANGHRYGIGREIEGWLRKGLTVIVSASASGREEPFEVERRLERRVAPPAPALEIVNDGALETAGRRLLDFVTSAVPPAAQERRPQPARA